MQKILYLVITFSLNNFLFGQDSVKAQNIFQNFEVGLGCSLPYQKFSLVKTEIGNSTYDQVGFYVLGLNLTGGIKFYKDLCLELRGTFSILNFPEGGDGPASNLAIILKKHYCQTGYYWLVNLEAKKIDIRTKSGPYNIQIRTNDPWKEFVGLGFGVKIKENAFYEFILQFPLGDKFLYGNNEFNANNNQWTLKKVYLGSYEISMSFQYFVNL